MLIILAPARQHSIVWLPAGVLLLVVVWVACGGGGAGGGSGNGPAPEPIVSLSPTSLTFGQQGVGTASEVQTVTLYNSGNGPLSILSIGIGGANATDFAQTNTCGSSVAASRFCTINVTFAPTAAGSRTASLTITDNGSGSPHAVSLTGTGLQSTTVNISPQSLTFGQTNKGQTSPPQTVTLLNTGTASLIISSITLQGTNLFDFVQSNSCGSGLAPGANCIFNLTYSPVGYGYTSVAALAIADNVLGSPQIVNLTGTPLPPVTPPGNYWVWLYAQSGSDVHSGQSIAFTVQ